MQVIGIFLNRLDYIIPNPGQCFHYYMTHKQYKQCTPKLSITVYWPYFRIISQCKTRYPISHPHPDPNRYWHLDSRCRTDVYHHYATLLRRFVPLYPSYHHLFWSMLFTH